MAINAQEVLFIQALDNYPYDVEQCIEKLQYVISGDSQHVGAHYLMGRIFEEQMSDYKNAKYHYQMALSIDHTYVPTYSYYIGLLIWMDEYAEAKRVLSIGMKIPGADTAVLTFYKGILFEKVEKFQKAMKHFKQAKKLGLNNSFRSHMDQEIKRIEAKQQQAKEEKQARNQKKNAKNLFQTLLD